jgi:hypothetical protein
MLAAGRVTITATFFTSAIFMDDQPSQKVEFAIERFLVTTFEKLPVPTKVLIGLFGALNRTTTVAEKLELSEKIWETVRFDGCGPLIGQSEDINWLKGVCDGILLLADYW